MSDSLEIDCDDLDEHTVAVILSLAEEWQVSPAEVISRLLDEFVANRAKP